MADIDDFYKVEKSLINLDAQEVKGDIGLADFVLTEVSYDTVVLEMVDIKDGLKKLGDFYYAAQSDVKAWRRGVVIMKGPSVTSYELGDMVIFPGIKGLETGEMFVANPGEKPKYIKNGHFLSQDRIFGKVVPKVDE